MAVKEASSANARTEMLQEAKAMIKVSKHDHIVNILGLSVNENTVYLLLEYCTNGSIEKYLRDHYQHYHEQLSQHFYDELINWSRQIADAMSFLASKDIIHVSNF